MKNNRRFADFLNSFKFFCHFDEGEITLVAHVMWFLLRRNDKLEIFILLKICEFTVENNNYLGGAASITLLKFDLEFSYIWEILYNANFKSLEFEGFKKEAGLNAFTMFPQKCINATDAIGLVSKSGRYEGTFAHQKNKINLVLL